jgi:hypothetical protein
MVIIYMTMLLCNPHVRLGTVVDFDGTALAKQWLGISTPIVTGSQCYQFSTSFSNRTLHMTQTS